MKEALEAFVSQAISLGFDMSALVASVKAEAIRQAIGRSKGNQCAASRILGEHRNTLNRNMIKLNIPRARHGKPVRSVPSGHARDTKSA